MALQDVSRNAGPPKVAFFNDPKIRGWAYQIVLLAIVVYIVVVGLENMFANLRAAHIASGFGFLEDTAGFSVSQALIPYTQGDSTYLDVYLVGLLNTLLVSIIGIVCATILGFIVGVCRLSRNFLVRGVASVYVEVFRNIPLLLHIFIWYFGVLRLLPSPRDSVSLGVFGLLNNRGMFVPRPVFGALSWIPILAFVVGIVASMVLLRRAKAHQMRTGERRPIGKWVAALVLGLPIVAFFIAGLPLSFDLPKLGTFRPTGGTTVLPELISLFLALASYTAAFIAEIVRAGILSVSTGQTEAAYSLGLRPRTTLRLVVIPQALRVIIPPLTSQYLNLTKNSSLAVAIAYPDLVSVFAGTALNQTGQAVEILMMTMLTYLAISLITSAGMNWYNAKMSLAER
ncbi:amino acid ABC transporter permease [Pararhizobium mangrovi]|uniref:Amino acid ABC transporter permease n=1 Tax=Pararhizobium mangrovi TaxID=2590452 RepID=A0A506UHU2_9HYPH|nr:amino acid ABC transporter permease [Pararhizobium mangrovi]TPW32895.1 amino acid ABC transporter permease [Pararhizobium mangrovi]